MDSQEIVLNKPGSVADFVSLGATTMHQFKFRYSKIKDFPAGKCIKSPTFYVAGHSCKILYYPQGTTAEDAFMGLYLVLHCKSTVTASFGYSFLDKHGYPGTLKASCRLTFIFSPEFVEYGFKNMIERSELEARFVKDDYVTLVCNVTIPSDSYKEMPKQLVNGLFPFSLNEHIAWLLDDKEMTDVTFEVDGVLFAAHKVVLAARSPVFTAEYFSKMAESRMDSIQIKDIKPAIFKAMLHFIYSDSLPDLSNEGIPFVTRVQLLCEAADIYKLDGLKAVCVEVLMRNVSVDTIISTLALSEECNCQTLKDVCLRFASRPEILVQLALETEFGPLMQRYPSLLQSLNEYARDNDDFCNLISKKKRTN